MNQHGRRGIFRRLFWCGALFLAAGLAWGASGCQRTNSDDFDDRTLEKRPPVETEKFPDKRDPFRP